MKGYIPMSGRQASAKAPAFNYQTTMSWDTVAHIKDKYSIPLIVKGVMDASDAARVLKQE